MRIQNYILELKHRFFILFVHFLLLCCIIYFYKEEILYLISLHQKEKFPSFLSTSLTEIFSVFISLSIFLSLYFSIPIFFVQIGIFLRPALYQYESNLILKYFIFSILLFFFCFFFTQLIFFPYCWEFFLSFQPITLETKSPIHFEARLETYCFFFLKTLFSLQGIFQGIGIGFFFLPENNTFFLKFSRKILYFFFLIFSTLITPPDVLSQIVVTVFFIIIYESIIFIAFLKKEYKRANNGN